MTSDRILVADPATVRRAGRRAARLLAAVIVLSSPLLIGGTTAAARAEPTGIPLAVGISVLDFGCIVTAMQHRPAALTHSMSSRPHLRP